MTFRSLSVALGAVLLSGCISIGGGGDPPDQLFTLTSSATVAAGAMAEGNLAGALAVTEPAVPQHLDAHRWLYALPAALPGERARHDAAKGIGIAGDWLHSPRVEGAFLSGRALAQLVLA